MTVDKSLTPEPAILVIFGVTGDLVQRKLFPALINLFKAELLDDKTTVVGITRQNISVDELFDKFIAESPEIDKQDIARLQKKFVIQTMDVTKASDYKQLLSNLNKIEETSGVCMNRLYYLSIPPQVFGPIVRFLGEEGLNKSCPDGTAKTRLLVEKPFGFDLQSAEELIKDTGKYFREDQIFRIDHYLAKETVQNILSFRFSNSIFESIWDSQHIRRIEISALEEIGIENRASFYEEVGALRDLIQSHLLQLLAVVAMEEPTSMTSEAIHRSRLKLLKEVEAPARDKLTELVYRAQYESYKSEVNNPKSTTETYAAVELFIDSPRWDKVPIIIKTGKALDRKNTEIRIIFRQDAAKKMFHNSLTFRIQPNEGIALELWAKKPGLDDDIKPVDMDFSYNQYFDSKSQPEAYERVLMDVMRGDSTLFATSDEVLQTWRIVEPILKNWESDDSPIPTYKNNSPNPPSLPDWAKPEHEHPLKHN
jgi:glucose-6-phosphate 1-dehydrogenase